VASTVLLSLKFFIKYNIKIVFLFIYFNAVVPKVQSADHSWSRRLSELAGKTKNVGKISVFNAIF
jgi:hypothetical protein